MALTPQLKRQVQELWDRFWSSGIANPLTAIEQISYLIFLKWIEQLDDADQRHTRSRRRAYRSRFDGHEQCRWSHLREQPPERMMELVRDGAFPWMKQLTEEGNAFAESMRDAVFVIPKPSLLADAVRLVDRLPLSSRDLDQQGDLYEELLKELQLSGKNGQFRTPRHVVRTMVELLEPQLGETVCDPAAGTGSFLVGAWQWVLKQYSSHATAPDGDGFWHGLSGDLLPHDERSRAHYAGDFHLGFDFDTTMVRLGVMNMMLHGIEHPQLRYRDALSRSGGDLPQCDLILANPPFTGAIDRELIDPRITLPTGKTELLFVDLCLKLLRPGGRAAVIVPEGVLFGSSGAHVQLRSELVEQNALEAVVSLPGGVFRPYTGVKTAILLFRRGGATDRVLFCEVRGDGYTLNDKREPAPELDDLRLVPDFVRLHRDPAAEVSAAARGAFQTQAFAVERDALRPDRALVAGMYRAREHVEVVSERPAEILTRIRGLEQRIAAGLDELEGLVSPNR